MVFPKEDVPCAPFVAPGLLVKFEHLPGPKDRNIDFVTLDDCIKYRASPKKRPSRLGSLWQKYIMYERSEARFEIFGYFLMCVVN